MKHGALFVLMMASVASFAVDMRMYECTGKGVYINLTRYVVDGIDELEVEFRGHDRFSVQPNIAERRGHLALVGKIDGIGEFSLALDEPNLSVEPDGRGIIRYQGTMASTMHIRRPEKNHSIALLCKVTDYLPFFFEHEEE